MTGSRSMADDEQQEFSFDQPWNPISYFEEESEAIGSDTHQYSPSRLASLFETNINAVDEDIARSKHVTYNVTPESLFDSFNEPDDNDELDHFTLETENGMKVLDTTLEINRKAIFSDFDRLRRWQQSIDKSNDQLSHGDMFIHGQGDFKIKTEDRKKENSEDENIDFLLESLPNVTDSTDHSLNTASMNKAMDKLIQIENRLNNTGFNFSEDPESLQPQLSENADDNLSGNVLDLQDSSNDVLYTGDINNDCEDSLIQDLLDLPDVPIGDPPDQVTVEPNLDELQSDVPAFLDSSIEDLNETDKLDENNTEKTIQNTSNSQENTEQNNSDNSEMITESSETIQELKKEFKELDNIDELISSDDTNEADAVLAMAANIKVIPPTPDSDKVVEVPPYPTTTIQNWDDQNNVDSHSGSREQEETLLDLIENIEESQPNLKLAEELNNTDRSITLTGVEHIVILSEPVHSGENNDTSFSVANADEQYDNKAEQLEADSNTKIEIAVDTDPAEKNCPKNVSVCPVQQNEPIQCLTPDDGDGTNSEPSHVEMHIATETLYEPVDEQTAAKPNNSCSPLPDVTFEIQTPQCSSDHGEGLTDKSHSSNSCISNKDQEVSTSVTSERSCNEIESPMDCANESPVCFVADTSVAEDELDELLESLEHENTSPSNTTVKSESETETETESNITEQPCESTENAEEENTDNVVISDQSDINSQNSGNLVEVAMAAAAAPEQNKENNSHNAIASATSVVSNTIEGDTADASISAAVMENEPSQNNTEEDSIPSDAVNNSDANQERRTSLRTAGSASNSTRRVRFSLGPQYEGENSESANSNLPTTQQIEDSPQVTPIGGIVVRTQETPEVGQQTIQTPQAGQQATQTPQGHPQQEICLGTNPTALSEIRNLGWVAPTWVPDENAVNCMKCGMKFTVVKRRHHCRACGKVLCSLCCNMKYCLPYLDYKSVRVCQTCCDFMVCTSAMESPRINGNSALPSSQPLTQQQQQQQQQQQHVALTPSVPSQLPQAPPPYSETVDGHSERLPSVSSDAPPYSERPPMGATAGYTEQPAAVLPAGAHGMDVLPGGRPIFTGSQITEMMNFQLPAYTPSTRQNRNRTESEMSAVIMFNSTVTNLPPILRRSNEETRIVNNPDLVTLFRQINNENEDPISFIVNKNLVVRVKVINLDCCVEKKCWCFMSDGMGASNQEELVILIKCDSFGIDERTLTRKVLQQMNAVFEKAKHGHPVSDLEEMEFEPNMCCMPKNVGMLFFKHSLQCIKKLLIPTSPYLFGLYVEKSEMPWAKNFPLRLLLRIGAEFKYYPCPLFNLLNRAPVYEGVGRTILDLLADFRTFQYTIPRVIGVTINLCGKDTIIRLPQHRYEEIMKAVNACEENGFSLAGNFSSTCDGHLVSVEKDGRYKTQTLSIVLKTNRKVTCASFIVISAALKLNQDGVKVKASIIEDGVMVQVTNDVMKEFKQAVKDMKEFSVIAGDPNSPDSSKVGIEWSSSDVMDRPRLLSPIDGISFDNLTNMKIRHSYDYTSNNLTAKIHWVEVYFLPQDNDTVQRLSARELGQMTSSIAKACMSALSAHLMTLIALDMARIGLRVNLAADFVEYKIGANLSTLPVELLTNLDDKLVPAIHNVMSSAQERVAVELIFQVVKIV